jgi:hypothetical protein
MPYINQQNDTIDPTYHNINGSHLLRYDASASLAHVPYATGTCGAKSPSPPGTLGEYEDPPIVLVARKPSIVLVRLLECIGAHS